MTARELGAALLLGVGIWFAIVGAYVLIIEPWV